MKYMRNGRFVNKTYRTSNIILWRNLLRAVSKLGPLISQRYLAKISNANLFFCDNRQGELFTEVLSPVRWREFVKNIFLISGRNSPYGVRASPLSNLHNHTQTQHTR